MAYVRQLSKVSFYSSIVNIVKRSTATYDALAIADSCSPIY